MKISFKLIIAILFLTAIGQTIQAQDTTAVVDHSLSGQYQELLQKSYTQNGYKLINPARLSAFRNNFRDSLIHERSKVIQLQNRLAAQSKTIRDLETDLKTKEADLNKSASQSNSIDVFGIPMDKSTYNILMWSIVLGLGIALIAVVLRTSGYRREARHRTQLYKELSDEYHGFKTKANEKEKKLARELQTEKNRVEELLGRG